MFWHLKVSNHWIFLKETLWQFPGMFVVTQNLKSGLLLFVGIKASILSQPMMFNLSLTKCLLCLKQTRAGAQRYDKHNTESCNINKLKSLHLQLRWQDTWRPKSQLQTCQSCTSCRVAGASSMYYTDLWCHEESFILCVFIQMFSCIFHFFTLFEVLTHFTTAQAAAYSLLPDPWCCVFLWDMKLTELYNNMWTGS